MKLSEEVRLAKFLKIVLRGILNVGTETLIWVLCQEKANACLFQPVTSKGWAAAISNFRPTLEEGS